MTYWKLTLSYDGSAFHGWQVQPGLPSVQGALAEALRRITGETVLPQGSGRTDAGVHALAQVCSFALQTTMPAANMKRALNRALPATIRALAAEPAEPGFHARHSARRKTYEYRIFEHRLPPSEQVVEERVCSPFLAPYVWDLRWSLDLRALRQAAASICGTHDFTSFAATDPDKAAREDNSFRSDRSSKGGPGPADAVRTVSRSDWVRKDGLLLYRVTGSGFLHHMVRNLVGTMVEAGRDSVHAGTMPAILAARDRRAAGPTAPARGLFLVQVEYEDTSALSLRGAPAHEQIAL